MSFSIEEDIIRQRFASQFTDAPVAWPNAAFKPPDGPWVRFTNISSDAFNASIGAVGNNRKRTTGTLIIQVFVLLNTGTDTLNNLCDKVATVFEGYSQNQLVFDTPASKRVVGSDGTYYQVNVTLNYRYDIYK